MDLSTLTLPSDLQSVVGTEKVDFIENAKRSQPAGKSVGAILAGLFVLAFMSTLGMSFFVPLFKGEEVHFHSNGEPVSASLTNFLPLVAPASIIVVLSTGGLWLLFWGFFSALKKGGYFVGTKNRLIHYYKGNINSYDWEQFTGNMEINNKKGDISLQLRTGKMVSHRNQSDVFVPDTIYISGVADVLEIEKICRQRIKENDPTPSNRIGEL